MAYVTFIPCFWAHFRGAQIPRRSNTKMMLGRPSGRLPWTVLSRVFYGGFEMLLGSSLPLQRKTYDVVIVGSGAGGGMAAYTLTRAGANVLLLEAGGPWDNTKDSAMLRMPYTSPRRGASTPDRPFGEFDACVGGWELQGEPFTQAEGARFRWWRARMVGGRTNHWVRISLRFGPDDFKPKSRDCLLDQRSHRARSEDRATYAADPRHGARGNGRRSRPRQRHHLHRYANRRRTSRQRASSGAGGERLRDSATTAQLEVGQISAGAGQLEWCGRQVSHRHHWHRRRRIHPEDDGSRSPQRRRCRRKPHLHAVVDRPQEARFSARLPH